jgi:hypothetical protein
MRRTMTGSPGWQTNSRRAVARRSKNAAARPLDQMINQENYRCMI